MRDDHTKDIIIILPVIETSGIRATRNHYYNGLYPYPKSLETLSTGARKPASRKGKKDRDWIREVTMRPSRKTDRGSEIVNKIE